MRSLTSLVISLLLAATPAVVRDVARSPLPDDYSYGLTFRAHTYNQDERTPPTKDQKCKQLTQCKLLFLTPFPEWGSLFDKSLTDSY